MSTPKVSEMIQQLVSTPSISCTDATLDQSNLGVVNHLGTWLEDLDFEVKVIPVNESKANLVASIGDGNGGLMLAGHTDTVPCIENQWSTDPFQAIQRDDRFYGLGTCDMKGFFPIVLAAIANTVKSELKKPLLFVATCDEESSMAGARYLASQSGLKAQAAVIGEPTDLVPVVAHKGIVLARVKVLGSSGHSSDPSLGNSAMDAMYAVMGCLMRFRESMRERFCNDAFAVRSPTLNLGCMHAGDNPNRICEQAELLFDIRLLPNMDTREMLAEIKDNAAEIATRTGTSIEVEECFPFLPPYETSRDSSLVKMLSEYTGHAPGTVAFATEAPFFQELGIETVVCGPGSVDQAHQADEFLDIDRIGPTHQMLEKLIHAYCF